MKSYLRDKLNDAKSIHDRNLHVLKESGRQAIKYYISLFNKRYLMNFRIFFPSSENNKLISFLKTESLVQLQSQLCFFHICRHEVFQKRPIRIILLAFLCQKLCAFPRTLWPSKRLPTTNSKGHFRKKYIYVKIRPLQWVCETA